MTYDYDEYTGVEAQNDVEFAREALTEDELTEEELELRKQQQEYDSSISNS